jgi:two-component sensor histidine kinase/CheY-like chemotaxis protein
LNLGGQQLGKQVPIRLSQIFDRLRSILASLVGPSISLVYQLESAGSISAQPIHLDQIVLNLVGNAAEAIGSRGGEIRLRVGEQRLGDQAPVLFPLTPLPAGDYMTLEVIDNGPGVDSAFVGGLFESGMSSKGEGRGLGLATVKSLVLELGGGLSVLSTPGQGTRFKLFFPICVSPEVLETLSLDLEEESGLALPLTGHIVLCSEDNHFRRSMGMTLQHLGLSHEEATHAGELLTLLAKCPDKFDLMVLDVTHKEQQDQVLGGLAAIAPRAKTLIMSDLPAGELLLGHAYPAPNAYLQKPFRLSELARRLGKLLQS